MLVAPGNIHNRRYTKRTLSPLKSTNHMLLSNIGCYPVSTSSEKQRTTRNCYSPLFLLSCFIVKLPSHSVKLAPILEDFGPDLKYILSHTYWLPLSPVTAAKYSIIFKTQRREKQTTGSSQHRIGAAMLCNCLQIGKSHVWKDICSLRSCCKLNQAKGFSRPL